MPLEVREVHALVVEPGARREPAAQRQHAAIAAPFPTAFRQQVAMCELGRRLTRIAAPAAARNEQRRRQEKRESPATARGDGEPRAAHSPAWSGMARAAPSRSSSSETGSMRAMRAQWWPKGSRRRP